MYRYQAFSCHISSAIYFPELLTSDHRDLPTDIKIAFGHVCPRGLIEPLNVAAFFQENANQFWLSVPGVARFLVSDGNHILVDPCENIDEATLRVLILESCFKALLSQQKVIVLEGCAIKVGDYGVLFVMPSGYGKSTLSSLFLKKGYDIVTEDICAIHPDHTIQPSYPVIHLWKNIANQIDIDFALLKPARHSVEKLLWNLGSKFHANPLPIKLIYTLNYHKKNTFVIAENAGMINLTCPRWDYSFNELGYLLQREIDRIESDMLERMKSHETV